MRETFDMGFCSTKCRRMKKLTLAFLILSAAVVASYAGPETYSGKDKEVVQQAPPPCDWYHAHELNLSAWGTFAFAGDTGSNRVNDSENGPENGSVNDLGHVSRNRQFGGRDQVWGGGIDIKYFITKYIGLGAEGFMLATKHNITGAELATLTLRYPIGCSRFAPYAWGGIGAIEGGAYTIRVFTENGANEIEGKEFQTRYKQEDARLLGQVGAGLEIRLKHPTERCKLAVGLLADFSWNMPDGPDNNFGMARLGLNFAY